MCLLIPMLIISTSKGSLHGGLDSRTCWIIPTELYWNGCPNARPHPGLTNLESEKWT